MKSLHQFLGKSLLLATYIFFILMLHINHFCKLGQSLQCKTFISITKFIWSVFAKPCPYVFDMPESQLTKSLEFCSNSSCTSVDMLNKIRVLLLTQRHKFHVDQNLKNLQNLPYYFK